MACVIWLEPHNRAFNRWEKAQRCYTICPKSHSTLGAELDLYPQVKHYLRNESLIGGWGAECSLLNPEVPPGPWFLAVVPRLRRLTAGHPTLALLTGPSPTIGSAWSGGWEECWQGSRGLVQDHRWEQGVPLCSRAGVWLTLGKEDQSQYGTVGWNGGGTEKAKMWGFGGREAWVQIWWFWP